jgi:hypothetical protein
VGKIESIICSDNRLSADDRRHVASSRNAAAKFFVNSILMHRSYASLRADHRTDFLSRKHTKSQDGKIYKSISDGSVIYAIMTL